MEFTTALEFKISSQQIYISRQSASPVLRSILFSPPFLYIPALLTICTNHTFVPSSIHIIHTHFPQSYPHLIFLLFSLFFTYAPTYPHYPQVYKSPLLPIFFPFQILFFCTHLINLHVFYIFSAFPLDIYKPALLVIQYSAYESQKQFL